MKLLRTNFDNEKQKETKKGTKSFEVDTRFYKMAVIENANKVLFQGANEDYPNIKSKNSVLSLGDAECDFNKRNRGSGYKTCGKCGCKFPIACKCCPVCGK